MEYRNIKTGEIALGHCIGTTDYGEKLYQSIEGWEPVTAYECDNDGNWIEVPETIR